jgi:hypothetical protein
VLEAIEPATVSFFDRGADGGHINVPLDDVPIKATSEEHASLKVHKVSDRELTEVRAVQCLLDGGHGVGVLVMSHDCEAYPIVSDALVDLKFAGERAGECEMKVFAFASESDDLAASFYDT